jgi:hypothetical protein
MRSATIHSMSRSGATDLLRRGLRLEYVTLGWNAVGIGILAWTAVAARSVALAGFGLDSLIEIGASIVVVWELNRQRRAPSAESPSVSPSRCRRHRHRSLRSVSGHRGQDRYAGSRAPSGQGPPTAIDDVVELLPVHIDSLEAGSS